MTALADAEADILASTHWKELIALDTNCISSDCCNCIIGAEPINTSTADEDFIEGQSETNGISSLTFDSCGKHLAAGMKNGKIVLYRLDADVNTKSVGRTSRGQGVRGSKPFSLPWGGGHFLIV